MSFMLSKKLSLKKCAAVLAAFSVLYGAAVVSAEEKSNQRVFQTTNELITINAKSTMDEVFHTGNSIRYRDGNKLVFVEIFELPTSLAISTADYHATHVGDLETFVTLIQDSPAFSLGKPPAKKSFKTMLEEKQKAEGKTVAKVEASAPKDAKKNGPAFSAQDFKQDIKDVRTKIKEKEAIVDAAIKNPPKTVDDEGNPIVKAKPVTKVKKEEPEIEKFVPVKVEKLPREDVDALLKAGGFVHEDDYFNYSMKFMGEGEPRNFVVGGLKRLGRDKALVINIAGPENEVPAMVNLLKETKENVQIGELGPLDISRLHVIKGGFSLDIPRGWHAQTLKGESLIMLRSLSRVVSDEAVVRAFKTTEFPAMVIANKDTLPTTEQMFIKAITQYTPHLNALRHEPVIVNGLNGTIMEMSNSVELKRVFNLTSYLFSKRNDLCYHLQFNTDDTINYPKKLEMFKAIVKTFKEEKIPRNIIVKQPRSLQQKPAVGRYDAGVKKDNI